MRFSTPAKIFIAGLLVAFGVASRLLPHIPNLAPVTAVALIASVYLGFRYSLALLVILMLASDALIGFYEWPIMLTVYSSFILAGLIGRLTKRSFVGVLSGSLAASLIFFFLTNFAVWQFGTMYEHSISGLVESYVMALPFFRASLAGDLLYTTILFSAFELGLVLSRSTQALVSRAR